MSVYDFNHPIWIKKARKAFKMFDQNKDGRVDFEEFTSMVKSVQVCNPTKEEYEIALSTVSKAANEIGMFPDKPGLTIEEWVTNFGNFGANELAREKRGEQMLFKKAQKAFFNIVDMNKDGHVSLEELSIWLKAHAKVGDDAVKIAFDVIDIDKNGEISEEEFVTTYHDFWFSTKIINLFGDAFEEKYEE